MTADCKCYLCKPVPGVRCHPQYGYDLDAVREIPCVHCKEKIGDEEYVEDLIWARFGQMMFWHKMCCKELAELQKKYGYKGKVK